MKKLVAIAMTLFLIQSYATISHAQDYVATDGTESEMVNELNVLNAYFQWGSVFKL